MENENMTSVTQSRREVRAYDRDPDYAIVSSWWQARGLCPPSADSLPRDGYFLVIDGVEIVCAWLYVNNRTSTARVENLVRNPEADVSDTILAEELLFAFLRGQAEEIGKNLEIDEPLSTSQLRSLLPNQGPNFITAFAEEIEKLNVMEFPLTHRFTPGLYIREISMPSGSLIISEKHKTEHPYVISQGDVSVWTEEAGVVRLKAPYTGITKPGTQRILYIHEDTIWTTFHATDETDPEKIKAAVTEPREVLEIEGKKI